MHGVLVEQRVYDSKVAFTICPTLVPVDTVNYVANAIEKSMEFLPKLMVRCST